MGVKSQIETAVNAAVWKGSTLPQLVSEAMVKRSEGRLLAHFRSCVQQLRRSYRASLVRVPEGFLVDIQNRLDDLDTFEAIVDAL